KEEAQAKPSRMGDKMVAVVWEGSNGKLYRSVRLEDEIAFAQANECLLKLEQGYDSLSGELSPVPDEPFALNSRYAVPPMYGLDTFGKLFNPRQGLALATFAAAVRRTYNVIVKEIGDAEYAKGKRE